MFRRSIVFLFGIASLVALPKPSDAQVVRPNSVSVKAPKAQTLVAGERFSFQIELKPPPEHYGGGAVQVYFERDAGTEPPSTIKVSPAAGDEETSSANWGLPMLDGEGTYNFEVPIRDDMTPGKWRLKRVEFGRAQRAPLTVSDDAATFDVVGPTEPMTIDSEGPAKVMAGERYDVKVTLRSISPGMSKNCQIMVTARLIPDNTQRGVVDLESFQPKPGEMSHIFTHTFEPDYGDEHFTVSASAGAQNVDHYMGCRDPKFLAGKTASLSVVASDALVRPTSVSVTVNPSQAQLLNGEADRLSAKAKQLRKTVIDDGPTENSSELRGKVTDALDDVTRTENSFVKRATEPMDTQVVKIFFDDIRTNYQRVLGALADGRGSTSRRVDARYFLDVADREGAGRYTKLVISSLEHNATAYATAVMLKAVGFELKLVSLPPGAKVTYWRPGDSEADKLTVNDVTNTTVTLGLATWCLRFSLPNGEYVEKQHNAFEGHFHVVTADFETEAKH